MDTAGQEKFSSISENYYKQADCCLLVYDITSMQTFEKIKKYYVPKIKEYNDNIIKVVLLGNKTDEKEKREVLDIDGIELAQDNGYIFMESSCLENYNVSGAFTVLVEMANFEIKKGRKIRIIQEDKKENIRSISTKSISKNTKEQKCC